MSFLDKFAESIGFRPSKEYLFEKKLSKLRELSEFAREHRIRELDYSDCSSWHDYDKKILSIRELNISDKGIEYLPNCVMFFLEKNSKLRKLILRNNLISEFDTEYSFSSGTLQHIDLSNNKIHSLSEHFVPWSLKSLDLSNNQIRGALFLSPISPNLKILNLSNNNITRVCIKKGQFFDSLILDNNDIDEKFDYELKEILTKDESSFKNNPICKSDQPFKVLDDDEELYKPGAYINHCYNCGSGIHSDKNKQCDICGLYKCKSCGACFCNK